MSASPAATPAGHPFQADAEKLERSARHLKRAKAGATRRAPMRYVERDAHTTYEDAIRVLLSRARTLRELAAKAVTLGVSGVGW